MAGMVVVVLASRHYELWVMPKTRVLLLPTGRIEEKIVLLLLAVLPSACLLPLLSLKVFEPFCRGSQCSLHEMRDRSHEACTLKTLVPLPKVIM